MVDNARAKTKDNKKASVMVTKTTFVNFLRQAIFTISLRHFEWATNDVSASTCYAELPTFIYLQIEWNMSPRPIKNFEAPKYASLILP